MELDVDSEVKFCEYLVKTYFIFSVLCVGPNYTKKLLHLWMFWWRKYILRKTIKVILSICSTKNQQIFEFESNEKSEDWGLPFYNYHESTWSIQIAFEPRIEYSVTSCTVKILWIHTLKIPCPNKLIHNKYYQISWSIFIKWLFFDKKIANKFQGVKLD